MRVRSCKGTSLAASVASFVEEAFVRRELSDNFCYYNKNYDNINGAAEWARTTLQVTRIAGLSVIFVSYECSISYC